MVGAPQMDLVFLGTGASMPSVRRNVSSTAVRYGPGIVLVDCGEGTLRQMMLSGVSYMRVDDVLITHMHGDHFLGLPALIQSMSFMGREAALRVHGPPGIEGLVRSIVEMGTFNLRFDVEALETVGGDSRSVCGLRMTAVEVKHSIPCLGYVLQEHERVGRLDPVLAESLGVRPGPDFARLQSGSVVTVNGSEVGPDDVLGPTRPGRKVVFSGDTGMCSRLIEAAKDADVLVHEATVADDLKGMAERYGHSSAGQAGFVAGAAGVGRLILNHISGRYEDPTPILEDARGVFPASEVAEDMMVVGVPLRD